MSDRPRLPRRRLLGAVGTVGGAAALGGAGTLAFLSDEEQFANDRLVAGGLNLRVGWEEYYSDWSTDETIGGVTMRPTPAGFPVQFGDQAAREAFLRATRQDRFPPGGLDGRPCETLTEPVGDTGGTRPLIELSDLKPGDFGEVSFDLSLCDNPGYLWLTARLVESADEGLTEPESVDPDERTDERPPTSGDASVLAIKNDALTVLLFGGFGAFWTFALPDGRPVNALLVEFFTLQDGRASGNPASSLETSFAPSFPTRGVPGARYAATATFEVGGGTVEATRTVDLDPVDPLLNVAYEFEVLSGGPVDLVATQFVDFDLGESTGDSAEFRRDAGRGFDYVEQVDDRPIERIGAPPVTDRDLYAGFGGDRLSDAHDVGQADDLDPSSGPESPFDRVQTGDALSGEDSVRGDPQFALEYSLGSLDTGETAGFEGSFALAFSPVVLKALLVKRRLDLGAGELADAVRTTVWRDTDGDDVLDEGESVVFEGSLAQLLALASTGNGVALEGDPPTSDVVGDGPDRASRGCFDPSPATHDVGLLWELPVDHANELQGDSLRFDLGFYTEQCRHNDGGGLGP